MTKKSAKNTHQNLQRLLYNKQFIIAISEIRIKYAMPQNGFSTDENVRKWNGRLLALWSKGKITLTLSQDIDTLLRKFDLPSPYHMPINNFVFFNNFLINDESKIQISPFVVIQQYDKTIKLLRCFLEIFGDTTIDDIKKGWRGINKIQLGDNIFRKPLPTYRKLYRELVNLDRDAYIRHLREDKHLSLKETEEEIKKNAHFNPVSYLEIPKIIKRLKRTVGE